MTTLNAEGSASLDRARIGDDAFNPPLVCIGGRASRELTVPMGGPALGAGA